MVTCRPLDSKTLIKPPCGFTKWDELWKHIIILGILTKPICLMIYNHVWFIFELVIHDLGKWKPVSLVLTTIYNLRPLEFFSPQGHKLQFVQEPKWQSDDRIAYILTDLSWESKNNLKPHFIIPVLQFHIPSIYWFRPPLPVPLEANLVATLAALHKTWLGKREDTWMETIRKLYLVDNLGVD